MFHEILVAVQPFALEAIIVVLAGVLFRLFGGVVAKDTLHSALRTGVLAFVHMLEDGKITRDELLDLALTYARQSSPDKIKRLGADGDVMRRIAESKLNEILVGKGGAKVVGGPDLGFGRKLVG